MGLLSWLHKKPVGSSIAYHIKPRKVKFDWQDTPVDWIPSEPFVSYFVNEINMILPAGEFWFCRMYNKVLPQITDEKLKEDMRAFIRQEAMHAKAHSSANIEYLTERNIDPTRNLKVMEILFGTLLADKPLGLTVPRALAQQWDIFRLGVVAAVEHMTCILGKYVLYNTTWQKLGADANMLDLIKWHGAEEVEHRTVAFDVYRHLGGTYIGRYYLSVAVIIGVFGLWVDGAANIMGQDARFADKKPSVFKPWIWLEWHRVAKRSKGKLMPSPFWLAAQQISYLFPWYNPATSASTEDALAYLNSSPAAKRAQQTGQSALAPAV